VNTNEIRLLLRIATDASQAATGANQTTAALNGTAGAAGGAAARTRDLAAAEAARSRVLRDIETPQERLNANIAEANALFQSGALTVDQYHRALETYRQQAGQASEASSRFGTAAKLAMGALSIGAIVAAAHAYTELAVQADRVSAIMEAGSGSAEQAAADYQFVRETANRLGLELVGTAESFGKLAAASRGTALEGQGTRDIFAAVARASATMALSAEDTEGVLLAVGQMMSKGTVSAEELRGQMGERLAGAFQIAARSMGLTTSELDDMLQKGQVAAEDFLPKFAKGIDETFANGRFDRAQNEINRLSNAWYEFKQTFVDTSFVAGTVSFLTQQIESLTNQIKTARQRGDFLPDIGGFSAERMAQIREADARREAERRAAATAPPPAPPLIGPTMPADIAKKRAEEQAKAAKILAQSKIDLLKSQKDYAAALALEAEQKGLSDAAAQQYIQTELTAIKAKESATAATKAQSEAERVAAAQRKNHYDDRRAKVGEMERQMREQYEMEIQAAKDNTAAQLEIKRRYLDSFESLKREQFRINEAELKEELALSDSRAEQIAIGGKIDEIERKINASRESQAATLKRLILDESQAADERAKSLQKLADAAIRAQQMTAAAEAVLAAGGNVDAAKTAAQETAKRLDLEKQIAETRAKYAGDQAAQDQAETAVRAQADATERLEALTRKTADDQATYWEAAWKKAGENVHDALADMFEGLLNGQTGSFTKFVDQISRAASRIGANQAATAVEALIGNLFLGGGRPAGTATVPDAGSPGFWSAVNGLLSGGASTAANGGAATMPDTGSAVTAGTLASAGSGVWDTVSGWFSSGNATAANVGYTSAMAGTATLAGGGAGAGDAAVQGSMAGSGRQVDWGAILNVAGSIVNNLIHDNTSPYIRDKNLSQTTGIIDKAADLVSNLGGWFALAKLIPIVHKLESRFAAAAYPDRKQTLLSHLTMVGSGIPLLSALAMPVVKALATYRYGDDQSYQLTEARAHATSVKPVVGIGSGLGEVYTGLERSLGVNLGAFDTQLKQRGARFWMEGWDAQTGQQFFKGEEVKFKGSKVETQLDQFYAAVLKRQSVLRQFDDFLVKSAVQASETLTEINERYTKVQKIRLFEGERTDAQSQFDKLANRYYRFRDEISEIAAPGVQRRVELIKLKDAYQDRFDTATASIRSGLNEITGDAPRAADALKQLNSKLKELYLQDQEAAKFAKKAGLDYQAIGADKIAEAQVQAVMNLREGVADQLRQLTGASKPLSAQLADLSKTFAKLREDAKALGMDVAAVDAAEQYAREKATRDFEQQMGSLSGTFGATGDAVLNLARTFVSFRQDALALGVSLDQVGDALAGQFAGLVLSSVSPILSLRESIRASVVEILGGDSTGARLTAARAALSANTDPGRELALIQDVQQAVVARYQSELQRIQGLKDAYKQIGDYAKTLGLSNLSVATPDQRLVTARGQYNALLAKARSGDADALGKITGAADTYLSEAQAMYASSPAYVAIFKSVQEALSKLGATGPGANAETDLRRQTVAELQGLDGRLGDQLALVQDQLATAKSILDELRVLNATQSAALDHLLHLLGASGTTNSSLGTAVSAIQAGSAQDVANWSANLKMAGDSIIRVGELISASTNTTVAVDRVDQTIKSQQTQAQVAGFGQAFASAVKNDDLKRSEYKPLAKYLSRLDVSGFSAGDFAQLRGVGQDIQAEYNAFLASRQKKDASLAYQLFTSVNNLLPQDLKLFAKGGLASGWAIVGEEGPELVNFSDPGRVYTAEQTRAALTIPPYAASNAPSMSSRDVDRLILVLEKSNAALGNRLVAVLADLLAAIGEGQGESGRSAERIERALRLAVQQIGKKAA
jgi:tape measure domain-containing protein